MNPLVSSRLAAVAVLAFIAQPASGKVAEFQTLAPHAAGLLLADVESIAEVDDRPSDGCLGDRIRLRVVKATGESRDSMFVARDCPAAFSDGGAEPPVAPVARVELVPGQTYWFAVAPRYQGDAINQWWPKEGPHRGVFEAVIARDQLAGHPQYEPDSQLTYSYFDLSADEWRVQVEKQGEVSWSRKIPGERSSRYAAWYLARADSVGEKLDASGLSPGDPVLAAETSTLLEDPNEFGLPSGKYYVRHFFDGRSGARVAVSVSDFRPGEVERLFRVFQTGSQRMVLDRRQVFFSSGGLAMKFDGDSWIRRVVRVLDTSSGVWSERTYRSGSVSCGKNCRRSTWIEIPPGTN